MIVFKLNGHRGCLTGILVYCETVDQAEKLSMLSSYWKAEGTVVSGYGAKRDVAEMRAAIDRMHAASAQAHNDTHSGHVSEKIPDRKLVPVGVYHIGDMVGEYRITGLGKEFHPNADQYSLHGIDPWVTTVQYVYFR